jgi:hypothetical protein
MAFSPLLEPQPIDPSGAPEPGADQLAPLASDDVLGPAIQAFMAQQNGQGQIAGELPSLPEALIGSAMAVTGRRGLTGKDFASTLPPWAQGLAPEVLGHPDFDPYFGMVSQEGDERVYMGTTKPKEVLTATGPTQQYVDGEIVKTPRAPAEAMTQPKDETLTATQVMNLPYTWDEEKITETMKKMRQAGIPVTSFDSGANSLVSVWTAMTNRASMIYSISEGKRKVTPWDVLDLYKSEAKAAGTYINMENGSRTTVNKSVGHITEGEAWSSLQQTVAGMLGRDPSDQEVRDFAYRMNQLAAENPSISKTITQYKAGEAVSSSTHTEGGFSAADVAQQAYDRAQNDPEYGEYQSATTYYNAALSALGAIGQT